MGDGDHPPGLRAEQERRLALLAHGGDARARSSMIEANLGLVAYLARPYAQLGVPFDDLMQEGVTGLAKAVDRFDPHRGTRFSTYAAWWIRSAIVAGLERGSNAIRLPPNARRKLVTVTRVERELTASLQRAPSIEEIAARTGLEPAETEALRSVANLRSLNSSVSGYEEELRLVDALADSSAQEAFAGIETEEREALARELVEHLTERQREVVTAYFGVGRARETQEQLAMRLGMSQTAVRLMLERALKRLRALQPEAAGARQP